VEKGNTGDTLLYSHAWARRGKGLGEFLKKEGKAQEEKRFLGGKDGNER